MPTRDGRLFVSLEGATPNTEVHPPAAGDAIHFKTFTIDQNGGGPLPRGIVLATPDTMPRHAPVDRFFAGEIMTEVKFGADATTPPEIDALLKMCGMEATIAADVQYTRRAAPNLSTLSDSTATIRLEEVPGGDGNEYVAIGSRCAGFRLRAAFNQAPEITFPYVGRQLDPADIASLDSGTYSSALPAGPIETGGSGVTVHGYNPVLREFNLNFDMVAEVRGSMVDGGANGGYAWPAWHGLAQDHTGELVFEQVDQTEFAFWAKVKAGTEGAMQWIWTTGSRSWQIDLAQTVFGLPRRQAQMGQPTLIRVPFTYHFGASDTIKHTFS